ncbi:MAG TPA: ABC transporter ATP-binding protein [Clostridiales bacterium]|nr:ABC transporter ATP-binding protein [Clostridiales bacterium]
MIKVKNLNISLGGLHIIKGISFDVIEGEYLSLIGPNGAGKSTILKSLCKIVPFTSGSVHVSGQDITVCTGKQLASEITYTSQLPSNDFTVKELIMFSRYPYLSAFSSITEKDRIKVEESMKITFISEFSSRKLNELSSGERQRVAVASALAQDTGIILFDEPVTHLDPYYDSQISELIINIKKTRNITVVNATHNLNNALKYSDRIMALKNGKIEFIKRSGEVSSEDVSSLYGVGFVSMENPVDKKRVMIKL